MLKINKIDDNLIRIQSDKLNLRIAPIFVAAASEDNVIALTPSSNFRTIIPEPVFSRLEDIEINGAEGSSMTLEEALMELNSFVGGFLKGGEATSENNAGGEGGVAETAELLVSTPLLEAPKPGDLPANSKQQDVNKQLTHRTNEIQNKLADHEQRLRDYLQLAYDLSQRVFVADGTSAGSNSLRLDLLDGLYIQIAGTNVSIGNGSQESKIVDIRRSNIYATSTPGEGTTMVMRFNRYFEAAVDNDEG